MKRPRHTTSLGEAIALNRQDERARIILEELEYGNAQRDESKVSATPKDRA